MAVSGKGISAAVRSAVKEWMTDKTVSILYDEHNKLKGESSYSELMFSMFIRNSERWVRIVRLRADKGWVRTYYCKTFSDRSVTLDVNSNDEDTLIEYVTIKVGKKIIGGGKVKVPSALMSQNGRSASLVFIPFDDSELRAIQAEMEYGTSSIHALLFEERFV